MPSSRRTFLKLARFQLFPRFILIFPGFLTSFGDFFYSSCENSFRTCLAISLLLFHPLEPGSGIFPPLTSLCFSNTSIMSSALVPPRDNVTRGSEFVRDLNFSIYANEHFSPQIIFCTGCCHWCYNHFTIGFFRPCTYTVNYKLQTPLFLEQSRYPLKFLFVDGVCIYEHKHPLPHNINAIVISRDLIYKWRFVPSKWKRIWHYRQ